MGIIFHGYGEKQIVGQVILNPTNQEPHVNIAFIITKCVLIHQVISLDFSEFNGLSEQDLVGMQWIFCSTKRGLVNYTHIL
jgi:hypothetical protein